MTQDQTQTKKTSIDDESPDAWTRINKKYGYQVHWDEEEEEDNAPNEHPLYGDKFVQDVYSIESAPDMVDNPPHYTQGNIECIDAMQAMLSEEEFIGFLRGNSFKYRWRMRDKRQPVQDLRKAQWYEKKLKDIFENKGTLDAV